MIEMNYRRRELNIGIGIGWIIVALMYVGIFLFLLIAEGSLFGGVFLVISIPSALLGIFYIKLEERVYVTIDNSCVSIDRGLVRWPYEFDLHDVKKARLIGDKLRLELKSGGNYRIMTSALSLSNIDRLEEIFSINGD